MALLRYHPLFKQLSGKLGGVVFEDSWGTSIIRALSTPRYYAGMKRPPQRGRVGPTQWAWKSKESGYRSLSGGKITLWAAVATSIAYGTYYYQHKEPTPKELYTTVNMPRILYIEPPQPVDTPPILPVFLRPPIVLNAALTQDPSGCLNFSADIDSFLSPKTFEPNSITVIKFTNPISPYSESTKFSYPYFTTANIGTSTEQPLSVFKNLTFFVDIPPGTIIRYEIFNTHQGGALSWRTRGVIIVQ
jgi:hypothetical protein